MVQENSKKTVLIVEDDLSLVTILKEGLAKHGIGSIAVSTGDEALTQLKLLSPKPDLVLLDIMLPGGLNGFDILEEVKKDKTLKGLPIIVLTNLESEQKSALSIGAIDYIVKPSISINEVILKIKNNLDK